jgi:hypothetical protein
MSKAIKYGMNLGLIGGAGNGTVNLVKQFNRMNANPELNFDWKEFLRSIGKGFMVGGAIGVTAGAILDYRNSLTKPLNTDAILSALVQEMRLSKQDKVYQLLNEKADSLIKFLRTHFSAELMNDPLKIGSSEKGTALRDHFDIDIFLPFRPRSFRSTAVMMETIFEVLKKNLSLYSISRIRQQEKSVGVFFFDRWKRTQGGCCSL